MAESSAALSKFSGVVRGFANVAAERPAGERRRGMLFIEADAREVEGRRRELPEYVLMEPVLSRSPARFQLSRFASRDPEKASEPAAGIGATSGIVVRGNGKPLGDVVVTTMLTNFESGVQIPVVARTDGSGRAIVTYNPSFWFPAMATITPRAGFWSAFLAYPLPPAVNLIPLNRAGPVGWWQALLGESRFDPNRGAGIRIGVADTGVGPHPWLSHMRSVGAFLDGSHDASAAAAQDVVEHGTHVAGMIGARPGIGSLDYAGIAGGADVSYARVYSSPDGNGDAQEPEANNGDIATAIDLLAHDERVDILNLSLGGSRGSQIEQDAVEAAIDAGVLVICAAGNSAGPVIYPAAYPGCVAVAAVGLAGSIPMWSVDALAYSQPGPDGVFAASFNNAGPQVACAAPGVGIVSTVPASKEGSESGDSAPYMAMSGTSMASPAACAALATILARDGRYKTMPRDRSRAIYAWQVLARSLRTTTVVGAGLGLSSGT